MYKYLRKVSEKLLLKLLGLQFESKLNTLSTKLPPSPYFLTKSKFFILRSLTTNYLSSTGWWQSCLYSRAINAQGDALSLLTYPAIAFVEKLDLKEKVVLEFGSGASTFYFEKKCKNLYSYEFSKDWYDSLANAVGQNTRMELVDSSVMKELIAHENSESLSQLFEYDCRHNFALEVGNAAFSFLDLLSNIYRAGIVLIDGGPRNTLMALVAKYCKPGTFIIIDNSDATHNHLGLEHFGSQSFLGVPFKGHGPMNSWEWETSIYWKLDSASIPSIGKSWGALFK